MTKYIAIFAASLIVFSCKNEKQASVKPAEQNEISEKEGKLSEYTLEKTYEASPEEEVVVEEEIPVKKVAVEKSKPKKDIATANTAKKPVKPPKKEKIKTITPKAMPIIEYERLRYDFGEITEGDIIEFDINFKNVGNAPLQVLEADVTCGCTTPTVPFLDIPPGGTNKISITYNSVNKSGPQNPRITIKTNTEPAYYVFNVTGVVLEKEEPDTLSKK